MEAGDTAATNQVLQMARWAEDGIRQTYHRIGSRFDVIIRESEALQLGQEMVEWALERGLCARRTDGSVFIDLKDLDMGELTFLRRGGTQTVLRWEWYVAACREAGKCIGWRRWCPQGSRDISGNRS